MLLFSIVLLTSCVSSKSAKAELPFTPENLEGRWALRSLAKKIEEGDKVVKEYDHKIPRSFRIQYIFKNRDTIEYLSYRPAWANKNGEEEFIESSGLYEMADRQIILKIEGKENIINNVLVFNRKEMHLQVISEYTENGIHYKSTIVRRYEKI